MVRPHHQFLDKAHHSADEGLTPIGLITERSFPQTFAAVAASCKVTLRAHLEKTLMVCLQKRLL